MQTSNENSSSSQSDDSFNLQLSQSSVSGSVDSESISRCSSTSSIVSTTTAIETEPIFSREFVESENDPATSKNIYSINKNPIQPIIDFKSDKSKRKFLSKWYLDHKWLEYSASTDTAYCFYCRHFNQSHAKAFNGFNCWKNPKRFKDHARSDYHIKASELFQNFILLLSIVMYCFNCLLIEKILVLVYFLVE